MVKELSLEESYDLCVAEGNFIPIAEINKDKIKSMLNIVDEDLLTIEELKKTNRFNTLCKLNYDVLHTLTEAFLIFDKIKVKNHKCLFTILCLKHSDLDLDWNFFEKIRTKRNGIHYYGTNLSRDDWKELNLQTSLYINVLKTKIKQKLK
ncbi:MAG: hypothetical protein AB7V77_01300 [Candidatus Woesearchaeota archaeon]